MKRSNVISFDEAIAKKAAKDLKQTLANQQQTFFLASTEVKDFEDWCVAVDMGCFDGPDTMGIVPIPNLQDPVPGPVGCSSHAYLELKDPVTKNMLRVGELTVLANGFTVGQYYYMPFGDSLVCYPEFDTVMQAMTTDSKEEWLSHYYRFKVDLDQLYVSFED